LSFYLTQKKMIIHITPNVRINQGDPHNWTLERRQVIGSGKFKGQDSWPTVGHYSSPAGAAKALLNAHFYLLSEEGAENETIPLKALIVATEMWGKKIEQACKNIEVK
jgi:hypothetical protein